MKRFLLHTLFWLAYLLLDTLLVFFWDLPGLNYLPDSERMLLALSLSIGPLIPKIVFTYFIAYVILDGFVHVGILRLLMIWIVSAIVFALIIRLVQTSIVYPLAFRKDISTPSFLDTFSFLFAIMDLGFVSGAAVAIRQLQQRMASKKRDELILRASLETELKYLKSQINPHFLFNTLNNIYALARKKSDDTADVVLKLSKILRFVLYESPKPAITIQEELKLMEDYIDLETIRHRQKINISFKKDVDDPSQPVSPFLLLPFLENAFKHGLNESYFDASINLDVKLKAGQLLFEIENTKERANQEGETPKGIGMSNSKRQLELLYPDHTLEVINSKETFTVKLRVNLNRNGKA